MKPPFHAAAMMMLPCGFLLSILSLYAIDPVCDAVQQNRLRQAGLRDTNSAVDEFAKQIEAVQDIGRGVSNAAADGKLTAAKFSELATAAEKHPGIRTIEWMPRVFPQDREHFQSQLEKENGQSIEIRTHRNGTILEIPDDEVVQPTQYLYPEQELTVEKIGFQRGRWAAKEFAETWDRPYLTPPHRFFRESTKSYGLFIGYGKHPVDQGRTGMLLATLDTALAESVNGDTTVTLVDVTPTDYWPNAKGTVKDRQLHQIHATPDSFVARKQIGGRLFEMTATENRDAGFRPIWMAWTSFFLCNVTAALISLRISRRESKRLHNQNDRLRREVERRTLVQSRLEELLEFREQERELIAHEIHDGFVQDIIGAQMFVEAVRAQLNQDGARSNQQLETVAVLLKQSIDEARHTIDSLKPKVVDEVGLVGALQSDVEGDEERYDFHTDFIAPSDLPRLPLLSERILYRMIRECITNVRKHSGQQSASLWLSADDEMVVAKIIDNGSGFDPSAPTDKHSFGLAGLRHRAKLLSGTIEIDTSEMGTRVEIAIPLDRKAPKLASLQTSLFPSQS